MASAYELRQDARELLRQIRDDAEMTPSLASVRFSQALALMVEVHNVSVEPEARETTVAPPGVGMAELDLLRRAFTGDIEPLIRWLSPRVTFDPSWICGVLP